MHANVDEPEQIQHRRNFGSWFGGTLGSCVWMAIVGSFLTGFGQPFLAIVPFACFACTLVFAIAIWWRHDRMPFSSGLLSLIAVLAFTIPVAWLTTSIFASQLALEKMNWPQ